MKMIVVVFRSPFTVSPARHGQDKETMLVKNARLLKRRVVGAASAQKVKKNTNNGVKHVLRTLSVDAIYG
jgi:hypothetical protein